jgi:hypothetical protein
MLARRNLPAPCEFVRSTDFKPTPSCDEARESQARLLAGQVISVIDSNEGRQSDRTQAGPSMHRDNPEESRATRESQAVSTRGFQASQGSFKLNIAGRNLSTPNQGRGYHHNPA